MKAFVLAALERALADSPLPASPLSPVSSTKVAPPAEPPGHRPRGRPADMLRRPPGVPPPMPHGPRCTCLACRAGQR